jgi:hypothetical protein
VRRRRSAALAPREKELSQLQEEGRKIDEEIKAGSDVTVKKKLQIQKETLVELEKRLENELRAARKEIDNYLEFLHKFM